LLEGGLFPAALPPLLEALAAEKAADHQLDMLQGIQAGLKGRKDIKAPAVWDTVYGELALSPAPEVRDQVDYLGLLFNDARAAVSLNKVLVDAKVAPERRSAALQALIVRRDAELLPVLLKLLGDPQVSGPVLRSLAAYDDARVPTAILALYPGLKAEARQDALATLASRPAYALALLEAVAKKVVPRSDISVFTARQLQDLRHPQVAEKLEQVWGKLRTTPGDKRKLIAKYKAMLTPDALAKADLAHGRLVFNKTCAQCHMLYGEGKKIGPDLTGSNRNDLYYVLENIIDPSAVISRDYMLNNIVTKSGRLIAGIIVEENERALTVLTVNEKVVVAKDDIDERQVAKISMMPEGQIEQFSFPELRDLVGYLATKEQVPLPKR